MAFTTTASIATFGGTLLKLSHASAATGTDMALNLFLPGPRSGAAHKSPLLIYLSGLTCSPENCSEKGFLHAAASRHGVAVLYPDTSPRGLSAERIPDLKSDWTFGEGASYYLDATRPPYRENFRMETYLTQELPRLLYGEGEGEGGGMFSDRIDRSRVSICGHSMGGYGALALYLRHPAMYRSVSAWAPMANPSQSPWGQQALSKYLGDDQEAWRGHDPTELVAGWKRGPLNCLIDVGTADSFYQQKQLLPDNFEVAVKKAGLEGFELRHQEGYDHSYYFISTFAADHVAHAAKFLNE